MVTYTLRTLLRSEVIDKVYIVAEPQWREQIAEDAGAFGSNTEKLCGFAAPGTNRQTSILKGMQRIIEEECGVLEEGLIPEKDTLLVQDAARPFLKAGLIEECYQALRGHDGVMPVLPMKDTVYRSADGKGVTELLDRTQIYAGQAPELYLLKKYYRANTALLPDRIKEINGATEPAILSGMDVVMIPGDEGNFKVTTAVDMEKYLSEADL